MKVSECWNSYRKERLVNTVDQRRAEVAWRNLEPYFGEKTVTSITPDLVNNYIRSREVSTSTVRRELVLLKAALGWNVRTGRIKSEPFIQLPPESSPRVRFLTEDEVLRLIRASRQHGLESFVKLAILTGQRRSALLGLTWDQVDWREGVIRFQDSQDSLLARRKGKGVVPITPALETLLRGIERKGRHVLNSAAFRYRWDRMVTEAGMPDVTPHVLRHTTATILCKKGVSLLEISKLLGHRSSRITEKVYITFTPDYLRSAVTQMEGLVA